MCMRRTVWNLWERGVCCLNCPVPLSSPHWAYPPRYAGTTLSVPSLFPCSQLLAFLVHCWPPSLASSLASLFSDTLNRHLGSARCYLLRSCVMGAQLASMRAWERPEMPPAPVFKIWEATVQTSVNPRHCGRFVLQQEKQKASKTLTLTKAAVWISPGKEWSLEHLCCVWEDVQME